MAVPLWGRPCCGLRPERWTRREPFSFRIEGLRASQWQELYRGDEEVLVGRPYRSVVEVALPAGVERLRLRCTAPEGTGVLIDDWTLEPARPMRVLAVNRVAEVAPVLRGSPAQELAVIEVETEGHLDPVRVRSLRYEVVAGLDWIEALHTAGGELPPAPSGELSDLDLSLERGANRVAVRGELTADAPLDGLVSARIVALELESGEWLPVADAAPQRRRIGIALCRRGQDGVHTYRIPALATTNSGTLIAAYDHRYRSSRDLPGDIDVGMSRSEDGGETWSESRVILDMGDDPAFQHDGVGDPAILVDTVTGTIWVAALWSHGNRAWQGSGPGMTPEETGQFVLVRSEDDGLTWSDPIVITEQVKDPDWRLVLASPGNGITMRDGTLVFPAQFRAADDGSPEAGKPHSTIVWSNDHGASWHIGTGAKSATTECQVVQLADGTLMLNCRDDRGGSRSVYTTGDLGETWSVHPTSRQALPEPVCNADLLRIEHPRHGALLFFSNPATTEGRHHFTLKVSRDEGRSWPEQLHHLYDERPGYGYSSLSAVGDEHVGVLYEGTGELYFLRFSVDELLGVR